MPLSRNKLNFFVETRYNTMVQQRERMDSMSYVALYRTWRPQDFDGLVGQEHIRKALTNALESGRISHAYLFTGPRGTGKTSTARILAKALNCEKGPTPHPCNTCDHCREITEGTSADVIEIDAASNRGIDEIRKLREQVHFAPVSSRYKVYIIDEVHMITADAFNALLKTLEEPPELSYLSLRQRSRRRSRRPSIPGVSVLIFAALRSTILLPTCKK